MATLVAITDRAEIAESYERFVEALTRNITPIRKRVGWRGGTSEFDVYWHSNERLWSLFDPRRTRNRYWCCFGPDHPDAARTLDITCEINFVFEGIDRQVSGVFLKDEDGRVYVGHSGRLGGGQKGIGKKPFLKHYDSPVRESVAWPDGRTTQLVIIGMLNSAGLVNSVATFVSEAAAFKDAVRNGTAAERELPRRSGDDHDAALGDYSSESLLGTTSYEQQTRTIEMRLAHGPVVHALRDAIEGAGLSAKKTNRIDLAAVTGAGELLTVFEVKTAVDWGSVYSAIGQLLYYGKTGAYTPKRLVAVLPTGGPADLDARLGTIGIDVVRYDYADGQPVFSGLEEALASAK